MNLSVERFKELREVYTESELLYFLDEDFYQKNLLDEFLKEYQNEYWFLNEDGSYTIKTSLSIIEYIGAILPIKIKSIVFPLEIKGCHNLEILELPNSSVEIRVINCSGLKTIKGDVKSKRLEISGCWGLLDLENLSVSTEEFYITRCKSLKNLSCNIKECKYMSIYNCDSLQYLGDILDSCDLLVIFGLKSLKKLSGVSFCKSLRVNSCDNLETLKDSPDCNSMTIYNCKSLKSIEGLSSKCRSLTVALTDIKDYKNLPEGCELEIVS